MIKISGSVENVTTSDDDKHFILSTSSFIVAYCHIFYIFKEYESGSDYDNANFYFEMTFSKPLPLSLLKLPKFV